MFMPNHIIFSIESPYQERMTDCSFMLYGIHNELIYASLFSYAPFRYRMMKLHHNLFTLNMSLFRQKNSWEYLNVDYAELVDDMSP